MDEPVAPATTRWQRTRERGETSYPEHFAELVASGADVAGEARLADALATRGARILDVGSGMGRVGAELMARGHRVTAVEPDPGLVEQSRQTFPDLAVVECDILAFDDGPDLGVDPGVKGYDVVVCVGNVLVFLAEGSERAVLAKLRSLLAPGGRVLAGFHLTSERQGARDYPAGEFVADAEAAGLRVDARFGSYELHPPDDEYGVWVLASA